MPTDIIGMFAAGTGGTEDAAGQIDIPRDGFITGVDWDARALLDADDENFNVELSFIATNQLSTNDVRGRISSISLNMTITTSGVATPYTAKWVGPLDLVVAGGERVYLHVVSSAGVVSVTRCNLHFEPGTGTPRRSARRR